MADLADLFADRPSFSCLRGLACGWGSIACPRDLAKEIESVVDEKQLKGLVRLARSCPNLDAYRSKMARR